MTRLWVFDTWSFLSTRASLTRAFMLYRDINDQPVSLTRFLYDIEADEAGIFAEGYILHSRKMKKKILVSTVIKLVPARDAL